MLYQFSVDELTSHFSEKREEVTRTSHPPPPNPQSDQHLCSLSLSLPLHLPEDLPFPMKADPPLCADPAATSCSDLCSCKDIICVFLLGIPTNTSTHQCALVLSLKNNYSLNLTFLSRCHLISLLRFPAKLLNCLWGPSPLPHLPFFLTCTHLASVCTFP